MFNEKEKNLSSNRSSDSSSETDINLTRWEKVPIETLSNTGNSLQLYRQKTLFQRALSFGRKKKNEFVVDKIT